MIQLIIPLIALAAELPGEELFVAPPIKVPAQVTPTKKEQNPLSKKVNLQTEAREPSNLPKEYLAGANRQSTAAELITPPKGSIEIFQSLKVGDSIELGVEHSVIAFPDEKAPVVAIPLKTAYRGLKFIGESYLEQNTHRIFINFTRVVSGNRIFQLKGVGISALGQPGLIGEYHSREAEYFAGEFISSFVAGYFDGLVPRHTNAFGQVESDPTIDAAVKKGLASGALSTAERFKEKLKRVPEFAELKGPFELKILILEQARSSQ